jgi:hypothetical protein
MIWSICRSSKLMPKSPGGGAEAAEAAEADATVEAAVVVAAEPATGALAVSVTPSRPIANPPILNTLPDSERSGWVGVDGETPHDEPDS